MKIPSTPTILTIIAIGLFVLWIFMSGVPYDGINPKTIKDEYCESINMEFKEQVWGKFSCVDNNGEYHTFDKEILSKK